MSGKDLLWILGAGAFLVTLLVGCGTSGPVETPGSVIRGKAEIDEITLMIMESFPVQVSAVAKGNLRDGCTEIDEIRTSFDEDSNTFDVEITTVRDAEATCTQALVPFEERVELDVRGLPAGTYTVDVNGLRETFTLDVDNEIPEAAETRIPWAEAQELIRSGQVVQLTQLHSLEVTLDLAEGTRLMTIEPEIDAVFDVVDACGEPCADIVLATE